MKEERSTKIESSNPIPEESMLSKQSLPYITKLLYESKPNKAASVLSPPQFVDNSKYLRTHRANDTQYSHAAAKTLRANSTSRVPLSIAKTLTNFKKRTAKFYQQVDNSQKKASLEEDIMLGESVNILERNKYIVSQMSMWKEGFSNNCGSYCKVLGRITTDLRQFYSRKKQFLEIFEELDKAGIKLSKIIEVIRCYRTGVAIKLHKVMDKYQTLIDTLLKLCYQNDMESKNELQHRIRMINEATNQYEDKRKRTDDEVKALYNLLKAKECELRGRRANEEALEVEVKNLREMLQIDVKNYQEIATDISARKSEDVGKLENVDLTNNLKNLEGVVKEMETSHNEKAEMLESMNKLMKGLLEKEKQTIGIQVDEAELLWGAKHYLGASEVPKQYEPPAKNATELVYTAKGEEKKLTETLGLESVKDTVKAEQPSTNLRAIAAVSKNLTQNWNIPPFVVVFIANSLKESKEGRVLPWNYFKKLLYDIYEEKIKNSSEIYGAVNTNYIPLEEFVLIYFLNKYKLRRLAEIKVIELLTSLKYYLAIWPRAKTFAQLAGFLRFGEQHSMETDTNNASSDIYLQDYYLTCFNLCRKDRSALIETAEGSTYFSLDREPSISSSLLPWVSEAERKDWNVAIKKQTKKNIEGIDKEVIDLDVLLSLYLEQYLAKKRQYQARIMKQFNKLFNQNEGIFTTEEIATVLQPAKPPKSPSVFATFPANVSRLRAFLYALTADTNSYEIKAKSFMQGCYKFGLDAPFPFIYSRVYLFGTSTEIEKEVYSALTTQGGIPGTIPDQKVKKAKQKVENEDGERGDMGNSIGAASALFAQHFSILRELRTKCTEFRKGVEEKEDTEKVWQEFAEIQKILDLACQFLDFPIET